MLGIALEKVCALIERVEAFDASISFSDRDPGSDLKDHGVAEDSEDTARDPARDELVDYIDGLNLDEQISLVALTWLGRNTFDTSEWEDALREARDNHTNHTGEYLIGIPLLGTYLEDGLSQLGYNCN